MTYRFAFPAFRAALPSVLWGLAALLVLLAPLAQAKQHPADAVREGVDYHIIENGQPLQPLQGEIEVLAVFSYSCIHCANFQPLLENWQARQPADVQVRHLPLPAHDADPLARAFFALQDTGQLNRVHAEVFRAIHHTKTLPHRPTRMQVLKFHAAQGLDVNALATAMDDSAMLPRLRFARQYIIQHGIDATPALIINGRYRIAGRTHADNLRIADALIQTLHRSR